MIVFAIIRLSVFCCMP